MLKCSFRVDAPYATHLHLYPYYMARSANREPVGTYWDGYGAGHELDDLWFYSHSSSIFGNLPEWTLVSSERGSSMYYPEPWEVVGNPDAPNSTGFCGWVPFYAKLEEPIAYNTTGVGPDVVKEGYYGFGEVYNVPEEQASSSIPCTDLTRMIDWGWDPVVFTSYTGPADLRGRRIQEIWGIYPKYKVCISDDEGNDLTGGSLIWGSWSFAGYGSIDHINVCGLGDWYSVHGDRIHAYVLPCDPSGNPITSETILEDWFPGFGPNYRYTWTLIEHANNGSMRIGTEYMRIDLNGYGLPDVGFRVGARLKKADGTFVGLKGLNIRAEYDVDASNALHPELPQYNPWVT